MAWACLFPCSNKSAPTICSVYNFEISTTKNSHCRCWRRKIKTEREPEEMEGKERKSGKPFSTEQGCPGVKQLRVKSHWYQN